MKDKSEFNQLEKIMLINAHPVKNIFNYLGGSLSLYYLWLHNGFKALIYGLGFVLSGTILATVFGKMDHEKIAVTFWGRIFLCYSTFTGFPLYIASHVLIPYAFWIHSIKLAVFGLGLMGLGFIINRKVFIK